jgi:surfeit locus 1 family protein
MDIAEAVPLEQYVPLREIGSRARAAGTWQPALAQLVPGRSAAGLAGPGDCWLVLPLEVRPGIAVPVVTDALPCDSVVQRAAPQGRATVIGVIQPSEPLATPPTPLVSPYIASVTTDELVRRWPYQLHDGYLVTSGITPLRTQPPAARLDLRNAAYAFQWWFFAAFAIVVWWRAVRPVPWDVTAANVMSNQDSSDPPAENEEHVT